MKKDTQSREIDYSFLLKCMTAFAAAAVLTVGVIGLTAAKSGASAGGGSFFLNASLFGGLLSGFGSVLAVIAVIAAIAYLSRRQTAGGREVNYREPPPRNPYSYRYDGQVHGHHGRSRSVPDGRTHAHGGAQGRDPFETHYHPRAGGLAGDTGAVRGGSANHHGHLHY